MSLLAMFEPKTKTRKVELIKAGEFVTSFGVFVTVLLPTLEIMNQVNQAKSDFISMIAMVHLCCLFDEKQLSLQELQNMPLTAFGEITKGMMKCLEDFDKSPDRSKICEAFFKQ
jgi:hypothetical protein